MKIKYIIPFAIFLCLVFSGACKEDIPTGPGIDLNINLSGEITLNGQSFSNVNVYLSWDASKKTTTGADGIFSFTSLLKGDYIVTPSQLGYIFSPSNYVVGEQPRNNLDFTAHPAIYGSGINNIAADFTAVNQNGQNVSLYDFFGKVILINFSADWCGPCRDEASHLQVLYDQYKDKGFRVITLLIDGRPSRWADEYGLNFPVLNDSKERVWNIYGEGYIPLNIVVDRNCTIRYKEAGYN